MDFVVQWLKINKGYELRAPLRLFSIFLQVCSLRPIGKLVIKMQQQLRKLCMASKVLWLKITIFFIFVKSTTELTFFLLMER
jgi:hypothetical protein